MNSSPLVSVLITVYNREKYLEQAIKSAISQTYNNIEIIIVDDCSIDKSPEVAKSYENEYTNIKFFKNKQNKGQFQNRNYAASLAKGKYIKFLDSDDLMYPHCIQVMVWCMENFTKPGVGLCKPFDPEFIFPHKYTPNEAYYKDIFIKSLFTNAPNSSIYSRLAYLNIGGMPEDNGIYADTWFLYKIAAKNDVVLMPHGLVHYRFHENQVASENKDFNAIGSKGHLLAERIKYLPNLIISEDSPLDSKFKKMAYEGLYGEFVRYCFKKLIKLKFKEFKNLIKVSGIKTKHFNHIFTKRYLE